MTDTGWLQAAKERAEAATEGPWKSWEISIDTSIEYKVTRVPGAILPRVKADADFIAHARTDLPLALDLLAEAEKLLRAVDWRDFGAGGVKCIWCHGLYPDHADDCGREAWLARLSSGGDK